jgi:hypothetical protein
MEINAQIVENPTMIQFQWFRYILLCNYYTHETANFIITLTKHYATGFNNCYYSVRMKGTPLLSAT